MTRGSETNIINPDGQIVKGYDYDEFGGTKEKGDYAFKNDVKFTGAVHDKSANLYYMNARFYNPNTGRFITEDTYSGNAYEPWTQHLYTYTSNNPVNFIDPTGHRAMYAMNPEDETDVQRSTSLNQMKGYSAKDSYKIATAKTKKKKQKAIKTAQENKEKKVATNSKSSTNTKVNENSTKDVGERGLELAFDTIVNSENYAKNFSKNEDVQVAIQIQNVWITGTFNYWAGGFVGTTQILADRKLSKNKLPSTTQLQAKAQSQGALCMYGGYQAKYFGTMVMWGYIGDNVNDFINRCGISPEWEGTKRGIDY